MHHPSTIKLSIGNAENKDGILVLNVLIPFWRQGSSCQDNRQSSNHLSSFQIVLEHFFDVIEDNLGELISIVNIFNDLVNQ